MNELNGRCLCNAVSFKVTSKPLACRICWCSDCQHIAGNGLANMVVTAEGLSVTGKLSEYRKKANSGNEVIRQFCPDCGVHLFAKSSGRPDMTVVRIGNLDDPSVVKPTANIWVSSAPEWACLNAELDRVEHQPK